jgi:uncharacterized protein (TIGR02231 family)
LPKNKFIQIILSKGFIPFKYIIILNCKKISMKYLLSCLLVFNILVAGAQQLKVLSSKPEKVTVFQNQALLEQSFTINLPAGRSNIVVEDIANTIDVNSIRVGGRGDVTLLGVKYGPNYLNTKSNALQDSLKTVTGDIELQEMFLNVANQEERMIMANADVKSVQDGLTPEELKEMVTLFRAKLTEVGQTRLDITRKIAVLKLKSQNIQNQINNLAAKNLPLGQIEINVNAKNAGGASFTISYVAYNAGWRPSYDIRVKNSNSPVEMAYKADVFQTTGLIWENVKLTLSTSNPSSSGVKPELYPQYLSIYVPAPTPVYASRAVLQKGKMEEVLEGRVAGVEVLTAPQADMTSAAASTAVIENALSIQFEIADRYTFKSGAQPETVEVQGYTVEADFNTMVAPKLDPTAYLVAELKNWEKLNLLPGEANVYFENQFIGKSYVNTQQVDKGLKLSLGRDSRINAKRESIENMKARKIFGSNIREAFAFKIEVLNLKNEVINLLIEDQIPVSQDTDIEVSEDELSGGELDKLTGKVTWKTEITAAAKVEKILKYTVKYPKEKTINNL